MASPQAPATSSWSQFATPRFDHIARLSEALDATYAIAQDAQGFMWFGRADGLARWDGYSLKLYRHDPAKIGSLPHDRVDALHVDRAGRLWIGTRRGLALFETERDAFRSISLEDTPNDLAVTVIASDAAGKVWAGGPMGVRSLTPESGEVKRFDVNAKVSGWSPLALSVDVSGTVWFDAPYGLGRISPGSDRDERVRWLDEQARPATVARVGGLAEDANGDLWIATSGGLKVVRRGDDSIRPYAGPTAKTVAEFEPRKLLLVRPGVLWAVCLAGSGLVEIDLASGRLRRMVHDATVSASLSHDYVRALFRDRGGAIWVGSIAGVDRHDPSNPAVRSVIGAGWPGGDPAVPDVQSFLAMPDGSAWVGMRKRGVDIVDPRVGRVAGFAGTPTWSDTTLGSDGVYAIVDGEDGTVWMSTVRGVYRADRDARTVHRVELWPTRNDRVVTRLARVGGYFWVGSDLDLLRRDLVTGQTQSYSATSEGTRRITGGRIYALADDGRGTLWIGTEKGLSRIGLADGVASVFGEGMAASNPFAGTGVNALLIDARGRIWAGTPEIGIVVLEALPDGKWRHRTIGRAQGLRSLFIDAMQFDARGRVWASTDDGIAMVDPDTFGVRLFDRADGMIMLGHMVTATATMANGELLFGGHMGLNVVRPWLVEPPPTPPAPVITSLHVGSRELPAAAHHDGKTELRLQPGERSMSVEFAMLDYAGPERVAYSYRLEGFDKDWVHADSMHRQAVYTNLSPGSYRFLVRGTDRFGQSSQTELVLPLQVLPAWYETPWFRLFLGLFGAAALVGLIHVRTRVLQRNQKSLEQKIEQRSQQLMTAHDQVLQLQTQQERELRRRAEETTRLKSEFLANMSHEIRTPMNAVIGLAHLALGTELTGKQRDYLSKIRRSGKNLLRIINDILDFSKIEAGRLDIESISFSLDDVFEALATVTSQRAADKQIEYLFEVGNDVPRQLRGDPLRLGQVLINLINNAIKFTEAGGEIVMNVSLVGMEPAEGADLGRLTFVVKDSGIGMDPDQLAMLFQPFAQADGSTSRKYGGTGLGLSISQRLVELMGGSIKVASTPGVGSTFSFELLLPVLPTTETGVLPAELNGARLLLVDDNRLARTALGHMLERLPVRFDASQTVEEAIVTLQNAGAAADPYQIVIVDWQMPGLADIELARALHGDGLAQRPRLILATPFGREAIETEDEATRADAVLYKPITSSSLLDALVAALGGSRPPELTDFGSLPMANGEQPFTGQRVLVADDNEVNILIATELLKLAGLEADVAYDGHEAVRLALEAEPGRHALIFMDLEMPGMDGHDATIEIRRHTRLAGTPIIALTAHAISEVRSRCMAEGMQDYLTKPIYPEQLFEVLGRWITPAAGRIAA